MTFGTDAAGAASRFAVAPMMDWTHRHCRFFHRLLSRRALLFTEMLHAEAVIRGDRRALLGFDASEHPLACQLGGSDPHRLAEAARIVADHGYDEINLNVGCPSDRVQAGTFGACLMRDPAHVGDLVAAMVRASPLPVSVKCRIGVDEQDPGPALDALADQVFAAGAARLWVHARKAWLKGLSPKENREIPPLDHGRVVRLKARLPDRFIGTNGGIAALDEVLTHLSQVDGVMVGRAAWHRPAILADVDRLVFGDDQPAAMVGEVVEAMAGYADHVASEGGSWRPVFQPMLGLFHRRPGGRLWRRMLTEGAGERPGDTLRAAFRAVSPGGERRAA